MEPLSKEQNLSIHRLYLTLEIPFDPPFPRLLLVSHGLGRPFGPLGSAVLVKVLSLHLPSSGGWKCECALLGVKKKWNCS